jgi:hypothetical protein
MIVCSSFRVKPLRNYRRQHPTLCQQKIQRPPLWTARRSPLWSRRCFKRLESKLGLEHGLRVREASKRLANKEPLKRWKR